MKQLRAGSTDRQAVVYDDLCDRAEWLESEVARLREEERRRKFMQTMSRYLGWGAGFVAFHDDSWGFPCEKKEIREPTPDGDVEAAERRVIDRAIAEWEARDD